jgi:periplasmic divalent cation tolerance protein
MTEALVVMVTAASGEEAGRLAEVVVGERLAACVNIVPAIRSVYRWQDSICDEEEFLLLIKTTRPRFADLARRVRELHSYDVPEIVALPIGEGETAYLDWLVSQVG